MSCAASGALGCETAPPIHFAELRDRQTERELFEVLYKQLRSQAMQCLRMERRPHSLSPTMLVHEAYLSLSKSRRLTIHDRDHMIRLAGRVMKNFIIDRARAKKAMIRGGCLQRVELTDNLIGTERQADEVLAVAAALDQLAAVSPGLARIVDLRYFAGFTEEEVAELLGVATRTVRRQWAIARTRLFENIYGGN